eukprot:scaffold12_cov368-Pavlova_lutheri.AAC.5
MRPPPWNDACGGDWNRKWNTHVINSEVTVQQEKALTESVTSWNSTQVFDMYNPTWLCDTGKSGMSGMLTEQGESNPICGVEALKRQEDCLIYSIGSTDKLEFEQSVKVLLPQCELHAFIEDSAFSNESLRSTAKSHNFHLHNWTWDYRLREHTAGVVQTWEERAQGLFLLHKTFRLIRIDCFGCENELLPRLSKMVQDGILNIGQIQVLIREVDGLKLQLLMKRVRAAGFMLFLKRKSFTCQASTCVEFGFLHVQEALHLHMSNGCETWGLARQPYFRELQLFYGPDVERLPMATLQLGATSTLGDQSKLQFTERGVLDKCMYVLFVGLEGSGHHLLRQRLQQLMIEPIRYDPLLHLQFSMGNNLTSFSFHNLLQHCNTISKKKPPGFVRVFDTQNSFPMGQFSAVRRPDLAHILTKVSHMVSLRVIVLIRDPIECLLSSSRRFSRAFKGSQAYNNEVRENLNFAAHTIEDELLYLQHVLASTLGQQTLLLPYETVKCRWDAVVPALEIFLKLTKAEKKSIRSSARLSTGCKSSVLLDNLHYYKLDRHLDCNRSAESCLADGFRNIENFFLERKHFWPLFAPGTFWTSSSNSPPSSVENSTVHCFNNWRGWTSSTKWAVFQNYNFRYLYIPRTDCLKIWKSLLEITCRQENNCGSSMLEADLAGTGYITTLDFLRDPSKFSYFPFTFVHEPVEHFIQGFLETHEFSSPHNRNLSRDFQVYWRTWTCASLGIEVQNPDGQICDIRSASQIFFLENARTELGLVQSVYKSVSWKYPLKFIGKLTQNTFRTDWMQIHKLINVTKPKTLLRTTSATDGRDSLGLYSRINSMPRVEARSLCYVLREEYLLLGFDFPRQCVNQKGHFDVHVEEVLKQC